MDLDNLKVYAFEEYKNMICNAFEKYMEKDYFRMETTKVNLPFHKIISTENQLWDSFYIK